MSKYWESETPIMADTGKNVLRYFEKAGKLQISMPYWIGKDGEQKPGKTVTVDIAAVRATPRATGIFGRITATEGRHD
jgi:lipoprotein-anchoring transpeptidase ErfK/SrfK